MIIREATEHDYDELTSLMQQLNSDDSALDRQQGRQVFLSIIERDGLTLWVAQADNQLLASCYLNVIPNLTRSGKPYALIENVVTHHDFRRQGIGRQLMHHAIQAAFTQGCYKVMLLSGGDHGARLFYESCGMERKSKTGFIIRE